MAFLLGMQLGIMGIITPYGTCPSAPCHGNSYLPSVDYRRLGAIVESTLLDEHPSLNNLTELQ
jgi:di/tricarboxylate transporter